MSTVKVTNLQHASSASPNIVLDTSGNATMAGSMAMATPFAVKNKIINGAMMIDQRNNGAAITSGFPVDCWRNDTTAQASFSFQQNGGAVTPPVGFSYYMAATSTAAYTPATNTTCLLAQNIEGFNCADLAFGTANAATVTLSFWVRSSLTGTHSGALTSGPTTRSYVYSYTINSANTWEYKTITIPGDTTGSWPTNNTTWGGVRFNLGTGTGTYGSTTTGWQNGNIVGLTTAVQVSATNGATFYVTGVQLEVGTVATPFERRLYSQELAMCQRYLPVIQANPFGGFQPFAPGMVYSSSAALVTVPLWVTPRVPPTGVVVSAASDFACWQVSTSSSAITGVAFNSATYTAATISVTGMSGMTTGAATFMISNNTANAKMQFTGCEL